MKKPQSQNQQGFTLFELLITLAVVGIAATALVINLPGSTSAIKAEGVVSRIAASVANTRREAMKGNTDNSTKFTLSSVYGQNPPNGITISTTSISGTNNSSCQCADNLKALCFPDSTFCYDPGTNPNDLSITFESGSGRLNSNNAIFVSSPTRKLVLLINHEGRTQAGEFVSGAWHTQTELQTPK